MKFQLVQDAFCGAALPAFLVSSVPDRRSRYSVLGIAFNCSSLCFAGTAPLVQTALVIETHRINSDMQVSLPSGLLCGVYLSLVALVSLTIQLRLPSGRYVHRD